MYFSKKHPLKLIIKEESNEKVKEAHKDAFFKIRSYKDLVNSIGKDMSEELKNEIKYEIQKNRARLRLNKYKKRILNMSYKGASLSLDLNNGIDLETFKSHKSKLKEELVSKRRQRKKVKKEIRSIEGVHYDLYGGVRTRRNSIQDLFLEVARRRVNSPRKPDATENHVGVELEFFSAYGRDDIVDRIIDAKLSKHCRVMTDNSIRPTVEKPIGLELCVVAPENKILDILEKACDVLSSVEAESNESCGVHVHLDSRNRNKKLLFYNLFQCQDLMFNMTLPSRKDNQYCRPQRSGDWEEADSSHYAAISKAAFDKHKTIEVRTHYGTTSFREIKNWILFLIKVANYNEKLTRIDNVGKARKAFGLEKDLVEYMKDRVRLLAQ